MNSVAPRCTARRAHGSNGWRRRRWPTRQLSGVAAAWQPPGGQQVYMTDRHRGSYINTRRRDDGTHIAANDWRRELSDNATTTPRIVARPPTVFIDRPRRPTTRYVYINFMCAQHSTACHVQPKKSRRSVAPVMATSRCHIFKKGQRAFYDVVLYCRRIVRRAAGCASWRPHRSMNDCYVCGVGGVCHLVIAFHNSSIDDRARMPARLSPCCSRRVSVHNMQPYPLRGYRIRTVCLVCLHANSNSRGQISVKYSEWIDADTRITTRVIFWNWTGS